MACLTIDDDRVRMDLALARHSAIGMLRRLLAEGHGFSDAHAAIKKYTCKVDFFPSIEEVEAVTQRFVAGTDYETVLDEICNADKATPLVETMTLVHLAHTVHESRIQNQT
jgi:hypothetical protein